MKQNLSPQQIELIEAMQRCYQSKLVLNGSWHLCTRKGDVLMKHLGVTIKVLLRRGFLIETREGFILSKKGSKRKFKYL